MKSKNIFRTFGFGASAFRYGLVPEAISDHLPITTSASIGNDDIKLMSWNLLADVHLYNNFMNILGTKILEDDLMNSIRGQDFIYQDRMHHLFSELAQFLYQKSYKINSSDVSGLYLDITTDLLKGFICLDKYSSRLTRSIDPGRAKEKSQSVLLARSKLIEILSDKKHKNHMAHKIAIKHSLELIYHIKQGALKWENRLKLLRSNKNLISEIMDQDLIFLQECTKIDDLRIILGKHMHIASHSVVNGDNVVVAFNRNKFLLKKQLHSDFEGKKPALYSILQHIDTSTSFVVGSIHHPGGKHNFLDKIHKDLQNLANKQDDFMYCIGGDFNHSRGFFLEDTLHYPKHGTMAGSDYGNTNIAVDAFCSNFPLNRAVQVATNMPRCRPARANLVIKFCLTEVTPILHPVIGSVSSKKFNKDKKQNMPYLEAIHNDIDLGQKINIGKFN